MPAGADGGGAIVDYDGGVGEGGAVGGGVGWELALVGWFADGEERLWWFFGRIAAGVWWDDGDGEVRHCRGCRGELIALSFV